MLNILKKIVTTGIVTEKCKAPKDTELEILGIELNNHQLKQVG